MIHKFDHAPQRRHSLAMAAAVAPDRRVGSTILGTPKRDTLIRSFGLLMSGYVSARPEHISW